MFRKLTGVTPSAYRKANRRGSRLRPSPLIPGFPKIGSGKMKYADWPNGELGTM